MSAKVDKLKLVKNRKVKRKKEELIEAKALAFELAKQADDLKGEDILLLKINEISSIGDYFIIITANSMTHVNSISSYLQDTFKENGYKPMSPSSTTSDKWSVLDYGEIVVHVMLNSEREYYALERFWSNAEFIESKEWKKAS